MFRYAQLNENSVVVGISDLSGEMVANNMIWIGDKQIELGSIYNRVTKSFSPPVPTQAEPQPTLEEISEENLLETKYQTLLLEMML